MLRGGGRRREEEEELERRDATEGTVLLLACVADDDRDAGGITMLIIAGTATSFSDDDRGTTSSSFKLELLNIIPNRFMMTDTLLSSSIGSAAVVLRLFAADVAGVLIASFIRRCQVLSAFNESISSNLLELPLLGNASVHSRFFSTQ
jgi:hypothetical protein